MRANRVDRLSVYVYTHAAPCGFLKCVTQAAFNPRVLASVCFFATDVHSATLGKGKNDDSLIRVRNGDLAGKGELVVRRSCAEALDLGLIAFMKMIFGKQVSEGAWPPGGS